MKIEPMAEEDLKEFVLGYVDGHVWTMFDVPPQNVELVFMPIVMGMFSMYSEEEMVEELGCIWASTKKHDVAPMSLNGRPCFFSCEWMNKADWERARKAIDAEIERRKELKV